MTAKWLRAGPAFLTAVPTFLILSCEMPDPNISNSAFDRITVQDDIHAPSDRQRDDFEGWQGRPCEPGNRFY